MNSKLNYVLDTVPMKLHNHFKSLRCLSQFYFNIEECNTTNERGANIVESTETLTKVNYIYTSLCMYIPSFHIYNVVRVFIQNFLSIYLSIYLSVYHIYIHVYFSIYVAINLYLSACPFIWISSNYGGKLIKLIVIIINKWTLVWSYYIVLFFSFVHNLRLWSNAVAWHHFLLNISLHWSTRISSRMNLLNVLDSKCSCVISLSVLVH